MEDHPRSQTPDFHKILGIPKTATIRDVCKAYKYLVMKWNPEKNPAASTKGEANTKLKTINEAYEVLTKKKSIMNGFHDHGDNNGREETRTGGDKFAIPAGFYRHRSVDGFSNIPSSLSKSASRRSQTPTTEAVPSFLSKSTSTRSTINPSLSKSSSRRSTTPIMFSHSSAHRKPPPIEKKLECTLEELCHGCVKKIIITRDVVTNTGVIVQEEELVRIKVKPGWKKGTTVTFEGMGDERPGTLPADITFVIAEKRHPLFKREGDDLVLAIEIPLVKALTGCTLSIPLLGGDNMSLTFEDIIYPGYEKVIPGQGMSNPKEHGKRGDLRIKFLVTFPTHLSDEQRSDILALLQHSS